eukprot:CAMPEP_0184478544 /NCGR_PEP_ID=MMETSP0113_2-20130426/542_1 /TAXON_ID=91329 /ORGANISM="Norrisiella sphaerica, Strain BC52" /LENGTH=1412 /DNA_ID=CAMNT_0026856375 /DNA_START=111 /DNA_END=4352 /DNA_ORIENTATION=-
MEPSKEKEVAKESEGSRQAPTIPPAQSPSQAKEDDTKEHATTPGAGLQTEGGSRWKSISELGSWFKKSNAVNAPATSNKRDEMPSSKEAELGVKKMGYVYLKPFTGTKNFLVGLANFGLPSRYVVLMEHLIEVYRDKGAFEKHGKAERVLGVEGMAANVKVYDLGDGNKAFGFELTVQKERRKWMFFTETYEQSLSWVTSVRKLPSAVKTKRRMDTGPLKPPAPAEPRPEGPKRGSQNEVGSTKKGIVDGSYDIKEGHSVLTKAEGQDDASGIRKSDNTVLSTKESKHAVSKGDEISEEDDMLLTSRDLHEDKAKAYKDAMIRMAKELDECRRALRQKEEDVLIMQTQQSIDAATASSGADEVARQDAKSRSRHDNTKPVEFRKKEDLEKQVAILKAMRAASHVRSKEKEQEVRETLQRLSELQDEKSEMEAKATRATASSAMHRKESEAQLKKITLLESKVEEMNASAAKTLQVLSEREEEIKVLEEKLKKITEERTVTEEEKISGGQNAQVESGRAKEQMQEEMKKKLCDEVKKELAQDLRPQVTQALEEEIRPQLKKELRKDVEERLRDSLREDVWRQLRQDLEHKLKDELREEFRQQFRHEIRLEVQEEVKKDLESPLLAALQKCKNQIDSEKDRSEQLVQELQDAHQTIKGQNEQLLELKDKEKALDSKIEALESKLRAINGEIAELTLLNKNMKLKVEEQQSEARRKKHAYEHELDLYRVQVQEAHARVKEQIDEAKKAYKEEMEAEVAGAKEKAKQNMKEELQSRILSHSKAQEEAILQLRITYDKKIARLEEDLRRDIQTEMESTLEKERLKAEKAEERAVNAEKEAREAGMDAERSRKERDVAREMEMEATRMVKEIEANHRRRVETLEIQRQRAEAGASSQREQISSLSKQVKELEEKLSKSASKLEIATNARATADEMLGKAQGMYESLEELKKKLNEERARLQVSHISLKERHDVTIRGYEDQLSKANRRAAQESKFVEQLKRHVNRLEGQLALYTNTTNEAPAAAARAKMEAEPQSSHSGQAKGINHEDTQALRTALWELGEQNRTLSIANSSLREKVQQHAQLIASLSQRSIDRDNCRPGETKYADSMPIDGAASAGPTRQAPGPPKSSMGGSPSPTHVLAAAFREEILLHKLAAEWRQEENLKLQQQISDLHHQHATSVKKMQRREKIAISTVRRNTDLQMKNYEQRLREQQETNNTKLAEMKAKYEGRISASKKALRLAEMEREELWESLRQLQQEKEERVEEMSEGKSSELPFEQNTGEASLVQSEDVEHAQGVNGQEGVGTDCNVSRDNRQDSESGSIETKVVLDSKQLSKLKAIVKETLTSQNTEILKVKNILCGLREAGFRERDVNWFDTHVEEGLAQVERSCTAVNRQSLRRATISSALKDLLQRRSKIIK